MEQSFAAGRRGKERAEAGDGSGGTAAELGAAGECAAEADGVVAVGECGAAGVSVWAGGLGAEDGGAAWSGGDASGAWSAQWIDKGGVGRAGDRGEGTPQRRATENIYKKRVPVPLVFQGGECLRVCGVGGIIWRTMRSGLLDLLFRCKDSGAEAGVPQ